MTFSPTILLVVVFFHGAYSQYCTFSDQKLIEKIRLAKLDVPIKEAVEHNFIMGQTDDHRVTKKFYNHKLSGGSNKPIRFPFGVFDLPNGWGEKKVLVVGNSYAVNQANMIREEFKGNYSEFRVISNRSLQILINYIDYTTKTNDHQHERVMKTIEQFAPDYIFITTKFQTVQTDPIQVQNIQDDRVLQDYNANIARLEAIGSKVFIQGGTPLSPYNLCTKLASNMMKGKPIKHLHLNKREADKQMEPGELRLAAITCERCEAYDTRSSFLSSNGDRYLSFDPYTLLAFMDNTGHFTSVGIERVRSVYRKIIQSL